MRKYRVPEGRHASQFQTPDGCIVRQLSVQIDASGRILWRACREDHLHHEIPERIVRIVSSYLPAGSGLWRPQAFRLAPVGLTVLRADGGFLQSRFHLKAFGLDDLDLSG